MMSVLNYITLSHLKKVIAGITQRFIETDNKINDTKKYITDSVESVNTEITNIKNGAGLNGKLIKRGTGVEAEIFNFENDRGYDTSIASGDYSHASGYCSNAVGDYSHAEGSRLSSVNGFYLYLTGEANATTYTVEPADDTLHDASTFSTLIGVYIGLQGTSCKIISETIINPNLYNARITSITLNKTISSSPINHNKVYIYGCFSTGMGSYAKGFQSFAYGQYSHAEGASVIAQGTGSYAQGILARATSQYSRATGSNTVASAAYSIAEGHNSTASNTCSYASGANTWATGAYSNASGNCTVASGYASHAEGEFSTALGDYGSHAEGKLSTAYAESSHAEGASYTVSVILTGDAGSLTYTVGGSTSVWIYNVDFIKNGKVITSGGAVSVASPTIVNATIDSYHHLTSITLDKTLNNSTAVSTSYNLCFGNRAGGKGSHAEGMATYAYGQNAHTEGEYTVSNSRNQHVQGKYNTIESIASYAHIVGNGTDNTHRSNAHTLDWDGNAWYAGKVTVGTAPTNDMDVATKKYVDDNTGETNADWEESDSTDSSYILNKPSIKAGTGENSIIEGNMSQGNNAAIYTIYITGEASATTFTYTTNDSLPSSLTGKMYTYVAAIDTGTNIINKLIKSIDATNNTISFNSYVTTVSALTNAEVKIFYRYTLAKGDYSHIEGGGNTALGKYSHAEGYITKTVGVYSHAEGSASVAGGNYSHAEGSEGVAQGLCSHAEGDCSWAIGYCSHAEGQHTIASGSSQHVQGKYNIEDINNIYADIVGNGRADNTRSNAYTLDWSGNGWYAGKLTVGTGPTANMDVATKKYVDDATAGITTDLSGLTDTTISSPSDGQLLKYNATTSKWENITLSLAIDNGVLQLKEGNTIISSASLPIYGGEVTEIWNGGNY